MRRFTVLVVAVGVGVWGALGQDHYAEASQVPGDCNQDAVLDISDIFCLLQALFGAGQGSRRLALQRWRQLGRSAGRRLPQRVG